MNKKKKKNYIPKKKRNAPNKKNVNNLRKGGKKLAVLDKESWLNQDVFWDKIYERNTKRKKK